MNLRWRFSGGILFSFTFHTLLIYALVYSHPEITHRVKWIWNGSPLFYNEKKPISDLRFKNEEKGQEIISSDKMIFPDLVIIREKALPPIKKTENIVSKNSHSLSYILTQVKKFPERVKNELSSNKKLSAPVVSLLSLLPPTNIQNNNQVTRPLTKKTHQKNTAIIESNELKNYLNNLSKLLSEDWEVPIHLKESKVTVEIMFEINKNGKILNWALEESGSPALHNSVKNLMKNLQFLPALPKSYPENSYIFGVRFSPTIQQR